MTHSFTDSRSLSGSATARRSAFSLPLFSVGIRQNGSGGRRAKRERKHSITILGTPLSIVER